MSDPVKFIDDSPMAKIFSAVLEEGPAFAGRMLGKAANIAAGAASSVGEVFKDIKETAMGASHAAPSRGEPEVSHARAREPQIAVAEEKAVAHHFDPADLGELSAPAFGSQRGSGGLQL